MSSQAIDPPEPDPGDLPEDLRREFRLQVALLNVGLLAGGAGLLVLLFTTRTPLGATALASGLAILGLAVWRYRHHAPS